MFIFQPPLRYFLIRNFKGADSHVRSVWSWHQVEHQMERNVIALGDHKPQNDLPPVLPSPPGELQGHPASGLLEGPVPQMPVTLLLGQWRPGAPGGSWCEWLHSEALLHHPTQWTAGGETCTAALRHCIFADFKLSSFPVKSFDDSFFSSLWHFLVKQEVAWDILKGSTFFWKLWQLCHWCELWFGTCRWYIRV